MTKLADQLKQGADQAWESLSEGWRELSARASGALTRFRAEPPTPGASDISKTPPRPRGAAPRDISPPSVRYPADNDFLRE